jgi:hypothetical protein
VYRMNRSPRLQKWGVGGQESAGQNRRGGGGQYCTSIQRQEDKRQDKTEKDHYLVRLGFIPILFV